MQESSKYTMPKWQRALLPCSVTLLGALLSFEWILHPTLWLLGIGGLVCDVLDGFLARRFDAKTDFGSLFDWTTDVVAASLVVQLHFPSSAPVLLGLLLPVQALLRVHSVRFCGRALLFLVFLAPRIAAAFQ